MEGSRGSETDARSLKMGPSRLTVERACLRRVRPQHTANKALTLVGIIAYVGPVVSNGKVKVVRVVGGLFVEESRGDGRLTGARFAEQHDVFGWQ